MTFGSAARKRWRAAAEPAPPRDWRAELAACIPGLHGWTTVDKALRLGELVLAAGAELSVEIGVFGGRGTIAMAMAHRELGKGHVVGIDPWDRDASVEGDSDPANQEWWRSLDHEAVFHDFLRAVVRHDLSEQCQVVRGRSDVAVRSFAAESVGVLHQDGNHSQLISAAEVEQWGPKLRPGGYWVMDDVLWPTTRRAQEMLAERGFVIVEDHGNWRVYRKP